MLPFTLDKKYNDDLIKNKLAFPCLGGGLFDFLSTEKILDINNLLIDTTKKLQNSDKKYNNSSKTLIPASKSKKYK